MYKAIKLTLNGTADLIITLQTTFLALNLFIAPEMHHHCR